MPASTFGSTFTALRGVLAKSKKRLAVLADKETEYSLVTKSPSPFKQHKGKPMWFASVRVGKAYVSYHLLPLYMNPALAKSISPALKKRMQGKACFNFKTAPEAEILAELKTLNEAGVKEWESRKWL